MPSKRIENYDERKAGPAVIAAELGWTRGAEFGWSWDLLLRLAERKYYANRAVLLAAAARTVEDATS